ncbi:MAG: hypothetical protein J0I54_01520 [Bosea sp.]|uniref:hypothetical protein n=1 Tax=unclassified Bosea (in: a-proteobacteria) TaxID=2653178 RepID=UPI001AD39D0D|nr:MULTISPECIES: hypothetical protein [unclassified Bosea (in: a-proteobacteria)]MBN9455283.1 hypothetical protein [Bosea sp. (in: a-proteobacteria)]
MLIDLSGRNDCPFILLGWRRDHYDGLMPIEGRQVFGELPQQIPSAVPRKRHAPGNPASKSTGAGLFDCSAGAEAEAFRKKVSAFKQREIG